MSKLHLNYLRCDLTSGDMANKISKIYVSVTVKRCIWLCPRCYTVQNAGYQERMVKSRANIRMKFLRVVRGIECEWYTSCIGSRSFTDGGEGRVILNRIRRTMVEYAPRGQQNVGRPRFGTGRNTDYVTRQMTSQLQSNSV